MKHEMLLILKLTSQGGITDNEGGIAKAFGNSCILI